jgi:hypothetical protein
MDGERVADGGNAVDRAPVSTASASRLNSSSTFNIFRVRPSAVSQTLFSVFSRRQFGDRLTPWFGTQR